MNVTKMQLQSLLKHLEGSLVNARNSKEQNEHGYAYSYGYLDATVDNAIFELKSILESIKE
jgi:hypothetical protein